MEGEDVAEVGTEETGQADRAGYWELSLGTEHGILTFAKGSGKNWWLDRGREVLSLDHHRGLVLLGFFAAEPPLLFALELVVEKV